MREDTLQQIKDAVYTLENNFRNPMFEGDDEPITLDNALEYVWEIFQEQMNAYHTFDKSIRFDGNKVVKEEMKKQILNSKEIKIA